MFYSIKVGGKNVDEEELYFKAIIPLRVPGLILIMLT
jgi:hypothetical protein